MEIRTEITKAVFEQYVPSAKMPDRNTSTFDRLATQLEKSYLTVVSDLVGADFISELESVAEHKNLVKELVCNYAFLQVMRSLDLVLTSTGFGVVSTNSTAPASKMRVDALEEEIRCRVIFCEGQLVDILTQMEGWGDTANAKRKIATLFYSPRYLMQYTVKKFSSEQWLEARGLALTADAFLRKVVSDEYMTELLEKTRSASLTNEDLIIVEKCNRVTGYFISNYENSKVPAKHMLDAIMEHLETYVTSYTTYATSKLYEAKHAAKYQNKKEDPTFFFM